MQVRDGIEPIFRLARASIRRDAEVCVGVVIDSVMDAQALTCRSIALQIAVMLACIRRVVEPAVAATDDGKVYPIGSDRFSNYRPLM